LALALEHISSAASKHHSKLLSLIKKFDYPTMHGEGIVGTMASLRAKNMEGRRRRILDAARAIIREQGIDALTTRGLAKAAGVSAPTLYNLIGGKDEIIRAMVARSVEDFKARVKLEDFNTALDMIEAIVDAATDPDFEGADYARTMIIGADRVAATLAVETPAADAGKPAEVSRADRISIEIATAACRVAIAQGVVRGSLSAEELGQQLFTCYRGPSRDWAYGLISIEETKRRIRRGFYLTLAADATPEYREILLGKIEPAKAKQSALSAA
jgi:AcrR family transcriptional regulator